MELGMLTHFFPGSKDEPAQAAIVVDVKEDGTMTLLCWDAQGRVQTRYAVTAEQTSAGGTATKPHVIKPAP